MSSNPNGENYMTFQEYIELGEKFVGIMYANWTADELSYAHVVQMQAIQDATDAEAYKKRDGKGLE